MATLDLKPLSDETIDEMGFNNHDLWMVRIGKEVLGPYETESLKQYAFENEDLFGEALASRMDSHQFLPFWNHPIFQRRQPQVVASVPHEGHFWLLETGQKSGPFSFHDIDKKIEMGLLVMTDHISMDEGHHWKKIFEIEGFDRRLHSVDELPMAPTEASFQKAKLQLVEKLDKPKSHTQEDLAEMCHIGQQKGKVLTLKLDELTLHSIKPATEVSGSLKWAVPGAAAAVIILLTTGYFTFAPEMTPLPTKAEVAAKEKKPFYQRPKANPTPQGVIPNIERAPASVGNVTPTPSRAFNQDSRYPTIMETHNYERPFEEPANDQYGHSDPMNEAPAPEVHSLVNTSQMEEQSLDAAMNGIKQPIDQPVIEEASDF